VAHNVLESAKLLGNASRLLADKAIAGFTPNAEHVADLVEKNPILVTALNPVIGYEKGAAIAKKAYASRRKLKEVAAEMTELGEEELNRLLNPRKMTEGGIAK
jgi:fumarate hydratase class II